MAWHFSVYLLPGFLAGIVSAAVAAFAWRHRGERTGRPFSVLMAAIAWWALAYGVELGYTDASSVLLWDRVAFVGSVVVPAALFWLAVEYAGLEARVPSWTPLLLAVEPLATLALVWSYPRTHLVWTAVDVEHVHGISLPVLDFGPWYWVNYAYSYLLIAAALLVIASVFVRGSRIYRRQSALLILGAVVPLGANVLYNVLPAVSPLPALDLTTSALAVTGILYGLALFHFRMLDLAPVARGMLLRRIGDGFVVVADDGALVEGNDVGRRIVAHDRTGFDSALAAGPDATPEAATEELEQCVEMSDHLDIGKQVSTDEPYTVEGGGEYDVALVDCGMKGSISSSLAERGADVHVLPYDVDAETVAELDPDVLFISNGPGDPANFEAAQALVEELSGEIPLAGICLGQQIVARAFGGDTEKMAFGHHGVNQPVRDVETGQVVMTTQNHGYSVADPGDLEVTQVNVNDDTAEGLKSDECAVVTRQYHPEANPGPHDSLSFFDDVLEMAENGSRTPATAD